MTHLERFNNSLMRKPVDRVPIFISTTSEMMGDLVSFLGKDEQTVLYGLFGNDRRFENAKYAGPQPKKYEDGTYDNIYGVRIRDVSYGRGKYSEAVEHPLANAESAADVQKHPWPSPDDFDYQSILGPLLQYPDYSLTICYFALSWYSWEMRGMSLFLEDLLVNEAIADAIIERMSDFAYEYFRRLINAGRDYIGKNFTSIHLADDFATQEGLLISPILYRRFFRRHYRRLTDLAHSAGLKVEYHCCGSAVGIVPDMIESGIDILNPIQTSARGMSPHDLKEEYGRDIAFSGGVDVQTVLPFGTVQEVSDEVRCLLDTIGKGGGYVLQPSHKIQVGTPPQNVVEMVKAAFEFYGMPSPF